VNCKDCSHGSYQNAILPSRKRRWLSSGIRYRVLQQKISTVAQVYSSTLTMLGPCSSNCRWWCTGLYDATIQKCVVCKPIGELEGFRFSPEGKECWRRVMACSEVVTCRQSSFSNRKIFFLSFFLSFALRFLRNPISFAIWASTFSKLCKNVYSGMQTNSQ
jgi:hypothetical protein